MIVKFNQPSRTFNGLFTDLLQDFSFPQKWENDSNPKVNIKETNNFYELEVAAPGISKEDFKINIDKNLLTISYDVKEEKNEQTEKFIKKEFSTQSFKRTFTLDEKIESENINARYDNGILKLQLPKKEEVKVSPKEIAVQ